VTDILTLAASGDASRVMLDMRVRSLFSPYYFEKVVLGYRKLVNHLHNHDTDLFTTRWARGNKRQFIEWSRAFYKTTCFTIGMSLWGVLPVTDEDSAYALEHLNLPEDEWWERMALHDLDATNLLAFETDANAKKKVRTLRWHLEDNNLFRELFPEVAANGREPKWSDDCLTLRRTGARRKDAEGTFEAIGVGGALQSRHYSRIWEDDLVGEKARKSPKVMEDTIGWHQRLSGAHESAADKTQFGVSNRWGYDDLNSWIRANEPEVIFYTRSAWELDQDPNSTTFGQDIAIFPEEYSIDELLKIQRGMTKYDFSCQYLNSPTMPGERLVDASNLHTYVVDENGTMACSCGAKWRASQLNRYMHYDPYNAKVRSKSCPAIVVVGTAPDQHIFLIDYFISKQDYGRIYDVIFRYNDVWRPREMTYEDVGHQNACEFHIREISKTVEYKTKHKPFPSIAAVKTGNRSKEERIAQGLFPVIEKKKFSIRSKHQAFVSQLETFPNPVFDHDYDLLDALTQGTTRWRYPQSEEENKSASSEEEEYMAKLDKPYSYAGML
jgi:hypothetical protein